MDLLGFLDCLKYLRLLEPVIQGFFVGIKIDIQVVFYYAAALILHCIDNAVNEELRSQGNWSRSAEMVWSSLGTAPE